MKRPIMLWITSRSRSSLVSKIFINHGVWWGDTYAEISGYEMYENQNIKTLLKKYKTNYWKKVHLTPVFPVKGFVDDLAKLVPENGSWMMKTGVEYFNAFTELKPYNIFIKRPAEDVAKSLSSKRSDVKYEDALHAARWRFDYMDKLQEEFGGVDVNTDKIIAGDFMEIKEAVEYCGIPFCEEAARRGIK